MDNIYQTPLIPPSTEIIETLLQTNSVTIERIISHHAASPPGFWYDQPREEWVILLRGEATLSIQDQADTARSIDLKSGDHLLIPAHQKHRVEKTSADALWLAIHIGAAPTKLNV